MHGNNPVEKLFWGRLPITIGTAQYYFTKESMMQRLMHQVKYRGNKELGIYLGKLMGASLLESNRFQDLEALVPLPLHAAKEKRRGYNQAALLAEGISSVLNLPVLNTAIIRTDDTESQTKKNRIQRWLNMENRFRVADADAISNKHLLLIDDVVTTGATLEACGRELLVTAGTRLSVATLCYSSH